MANNIYSLTLFALAAITALFYVPRILAFLLKNQKQKIRLETRQYIVGYPHKLFTCEVQSRDLLSKRKIKKIRKRLTPQLQGEIFFLEVPSGEQRSKKVFFEKLFYFTHKEDIELFVSTVNKFIRYERTAV